MTLRKNIRSCFSYQSRNFTENLPPSPAPVGPWGKINSATLSAQQSPEALSAPRIKQGDYRDQTKNRRKKRSSSTSALGDFSFAIRRFIRLVYPLRVGWYLIRSRQSCEKDSRGSWRVSTASVLALGDLLIDSTCVDTCSRMLFFVSR